MIFLFYFLLIRTIDPTVGCHKFSYQCGEGEVLVVADRSEQFVKVQCGQIKICGEKESRLWTPTGVSSECQGKGNYVCGALYEGNNNYQIQNNCCKYSPVVQNHLSDDCKTYDFIDPKDSGNRYSTVKPNPNSSMSQKPVQYHDENQNAELSPKHHCVNGHWKNLTFYDPDYNNYNEYQEVVKSFQKLPNGFRVVICKMNCTKNNFENQQGAIINRFRRMAMPVADNSNGLPSRPRLTSNSNNGNLPNRPNNPSVVNNRQAFQHEEIEIVQGNDDRPSHSSGHPSTTLPPTTQGTHSTMHPSNISSQSRLTNRNIRVQKLLCKNYEAVNSIQRTSTNVQNDGRNFTLKIGCKKITSCNETCEWNFNCSAKQYGDGVYLGGVTTFYNLKHDSMYAIFLCCNSSGNASFCEDFKNYSLPSFQMEHKDKIIREIETNKNTVGQMWMRGQVCYYNSSNNYTRSVKNHRTKGSDSHNTANVYNVYNNTPYCAAPARGYAMGGGMVSSSFGLLVGYLPIIAQPFMVQPVVVAQPVIGQSVIDQAVVESTTTSTTITTISPITTTTAIPVFAQPIPIDTVIVSPISTTTTFPITTLPKRHSNCANGACSQGNGQGNDNTNGQPVQQGTSLLSQGSGPVIDQGTGQAISQATGTINQGTGQAFSQGTGPAISQATGQVIKQGTGPAISQAIAPSVIKGAGQAVSQGTGPAISHATGQAIKQGTGQAISQAIGPAINKGTSQALSQGTGPAISQATGQAIKKGTGSAISQAVGPAVNQGTGKAINQAVDQAVKQGTGQAIKQGTGLALTHATDHAIKHGTGHAFGQANHQATGLAKLG